MKVGEYNVFILYGSPFPEPFYLLRTPYKGVPWRKVTQAINRLVKKLRGIPRHKKAGHWYIEGQDLEWNGKYKQYEYINGEFVETS